MRDIFCFPEKYRTDLSITKEQFIELGNITEAEKNILENSIADIQLFYDIQFPDGSEIVLIGIEVSCKMKAGKLLGTVKAVSSALPYRTLIYACRGDKGRLYSFIERDSQTDYGRSLIEKQCSTDNFSILQAEIQLKPILEMMLRSIDKVDSAENMQRLWYNIFNYHTNGLADLLTTKEF